MGLQDYGVLVGIGATGSIGLFFVLKLQISAMLQEQDARLKLWINGSFMRASLVQEKLDRLEEKIDQ